MIDIEPGNTHVLITVPDLSGGGAEKVLVFLANTLVERGWRVSIACLHAFKEPAYALCEDVNIEWLNLPRTASGLGQVVRLLASVRRIRAHALTVRPSVVLAFLTKAAVLTALALRTIDIPVVVSERTPIDRPGLSVFWRVLRRLSYPTVQMLVCLSEAVCRGYAFLPAAKRQVIYNPIMSNVSGKNGCLDPVIPSGDPRIVAMGRLAPVKGFDILLRAFGHVRTYFPGAGLTIYGEGNELKRLEALARDLGIAGNTVFPGRTLCPDFILGEADLFVLSSRYEGFGNVLVEAMTAGTPVVALDCPGGIREVIEDGLAGVLVPPEDAVALAAAITEVLKDDERRRLLVEAGRKSVSRFSPGHIIDRWETVLKTGCRG